LKILFITTTGFPWGGSEELWSQAAIQLRKQGHAVSASVGYFGSVHQKVQKLMDEGIRIRFRKNFVLDTACQGLEKFGLSSFRNLISNSFEKHIQEEKPDMVVVSQATCFGAYELMLFCKNKQIPYCSISQLNTEYGWPSEEKVERIAEAFHGANAVFFVSERNLDLFQMQIAEKLQNAFVIPNPFNLKKIPELAWAEKDYFEIAHVARLDFTHKGTDILLKCFAEKQWKNRNFRLNIYGDGNLKLANKLAAYCGTYNICFMGHVDNVAEIWKQNHLLVLSSRYEGMPLSLIEAMYCSRPAVVTDVAGHAELIEDGHSGFIAEAATYKKVSEALERAWEGKREWESMGRNAKTRIEQVYSLDPVKIFIGHLMAAIKNHAA
jgi:glycosyltransferase involved in cell wall biosynthesis